MSLIGTDDVVAAIRKVSAMSLAQKEALADEIHQRQPHMLASCLVQSGLGAKPAAHEFLLPRLARLLSVDERIWFAVARHHRR
jgi:hypothetical protein